MWHASGIGRFGIGRIGSGNRRYIYPEPLLPDGAILGILFVETFQLHYATGDAQQPVHTVKSGERAAKGGNRPLSFHNYSKVTSSHDAWRPFGDLGVNP